MKQRTQHLVLHVLCSVTVTLCCAYLKAEKHIAANSEFADADVVGRVQLFPNDGDLGLQDSLSPEPPPETFTNNRSQAIAGRLIVGDLQPEEFASFGAGPTICNEPLLQLPEAPPPELDFVEPLTAPSPSDAMFSFVYQDGEVQCISAPHGVRDGEILVRSVEPTTDVPPFWVQRDRVTLDWLYLSPRNLDLAYATPVATSSITAAPVAASHVADFGYKSGIRIGAALATSDTGSITVSWSSFEASDSHRSQTAAGGPYLRSELLTPLVPRVAADSQWSSVWNSAGFQTFDIACEKTWWHTCGSRLTASIGVRRGEIEQSLAASHVAMGTQPMIAGINYTGWGPRAGIEYERIGARGLITYGRSGFSVLDGQFENRYHDAATAIALTESRVVPQLDVELGAGWETADGGFRLTAGYLVSVWGNSVSMPDFVHGATQGGLNGLSETIIFDGFTVRCELKY